MEGNAERYTLGATTIQLINNGLGGTASISDAERYYFYSQLPGIGVEIGSVGLQVGARLAANRWAAAQAAAAERLIVNRLAYEASLPGGANTLTVTDNVGGSSFYDLVTARLASPGAGVAQSVRVGAAESNVARQTLFHYTNEAGAKGITGSSSLNPSLWRVGTKDVRYGNGQYLSDIVPGTRTPSELSYDFLGQPFQGNRFTHYVEIDATGLGAVQGRAGVYVVPNEVPLDLTGRLLNSGKVPGK